MCENASKLTVGVSAELPEGTVSPKAQQAVFPADGHRLHEVPERRSDLEPNRTGPGQRLSKSVTVRATDLSYLSVTDREDGSLLLYLHTLLLQNKSMQIPSTS